MDLWEIESSFLRVASSERNGASTYEEMAKEKLGRSCSLEQLPTPARAQAIALWQPKGTCRLIPVGKGYITIFLDNEEDRNKIWSGGPWVIGKQLLRLSPWSPFFDPEKQRNTHALVWVKFPGLGVEFWEVDTLMVLGRTLGTPIQVDHSSTTIEFGYFAKVLVEVDLADPIPKKILVEVEGGDFLQKVELGATPKFCSHCKIIGHTFVECRAIKEQVQRAEDPKNFTKRSQQLKTPSQRTKRRELGKKIKERPFPMGRIWTWGQRPGNLWCLWKSGPNVPVLVVASSQQIAISYDGFLLSAIHGMVTTSARRAFWTDMESITNLNLPWLAIGNFNCIRSWDERSGGTGPLPCSITDFNDCIDACRLTESFTSGPKYSWRNNQKGRAKILRRLDRALYNNAWIQKFDGWSCKYLARDNSDHSALVGSIQSIPKPSNIPFRFLSGWVTASSFRDLVICSWDESFIGDPNFVLMKKLQRLKAAIKT
ncbi:hypothetical protein GIB67_008930 [Kingdonia uniflora]|uniref:DUF4283 domain-containing protein n=1 Tax=Kingdonia uniflora TaxID=39325 RepID=A0A7J7LVP8_9MAGN|nr:hypothetical protein GIB67_008930 [Kingdonia uniflora]